VTAVPTRPSLTVRAQVAVAISCAIAAMAFAGAVTEHALIGFVIPATALSAVTAGLFITHHQPKAAAATGVMLAIAWAEIANVVTGLTNGPAARSSFVAGSCAALALAAAASRFPSLFLVPVGGIVLGAVLLGSGGEVRIVAMVTVAAATVALAVVESSHRRWVRAPDSPPPSRRWSVGVVAILVTVAAALAAVTQARHDPRAPHAAINGSHNSLVTPPWTDPFPKTSVNSTTSSTTVKQIKHHVRRHHVRPVHRPPYHHTHHTVLDIILIVALSLLVLLAIWIGVRLYRVRRAWRRIHRDLRTPSAAGVIGAWVWMSLRLAAYRIPLPAQLSPDVVDRGGLVHEVPPDTAEPLRNLARLVTPAAFGADHDNTGVDAENAWALSDQVCEAAEASLSRFGHIRLRFAAAPAVPPTGSSRPASSAVARR
jgi:hypothetical protein